MTFRLVVTTVAMISAVSATGCSEAVPPASEGAVIGNFSTASAGQCGQEPDTTPCQCNIELHNMQVGFAHASDAGQITFVKDGDGGARVFCSVAPAGSGFEAQGVIESGANLLEFKVNLSGANTEDNKAPGSVAYRTVYTVDQFQSPAETPCNFWVSTEQEVTAGRMWVQWECAEVLDASAGRGCKIGQSTLAMQNCDQ